jgi:hypothetical protein
MDFAKRSHILSGLVLSIALSASGCTICSNPFDCDYVTYGSRTPRHDMKHGRVGSIFSDSTMVASGTIESVDAIDMSYADVLEQTNPEQFSQDEPVEESMLTSEATGTSSDPILFDPS